MRPPFPRPIVRDACTSALSCAAFTTHSVRLETRVSRGSSRRRIVVGDACIRVHASSVYPSVYAVCEPSSCCSCGRHWARDLHGVLRSAMTCPIRLVCPRRKAEKPEGSPLPPAGPHGCPIMADCDMFPSQNPTSLTVSQRGGTKQLCRASTWCSTKPFARIPAITGVII